MTSGEGYCDDATRLRDHIDSLKPRWRPIETAPKDGTRLLVYDPASDGEEVLIAEWMDEVRAWVVYRVHYAELRTCNPTHYMPLPEAPT